MQTAGVGLVVNQTGSAVGPGQATLQGQLDAGQRRTSAPGPGPGGPLPGPSQAATPALQTGRWSGRAGGGRGST